MSNMQNQTEIKPLVLKAVISLVNPRDGREHPYQPDSEESEAVILDMYEFVVKSVNPIAYMVDWMKYHIDNLFTRDTDTD